MDEKKRKISGFVCSGVGGAFFIAGLVFFAMSNWVNLYAQKTTASILSQCDVTSEDGTHFYILELSYSVGNDIVVTTTEYYEPLEEDTMEMEIYYNIKRPKAILNGGWTFWPLLVTFLGALIVVPGLSYLGVIELSLFEPAHVSPYASEKKKKLVKAKERMENNAIPSIGALGILAFGIISLIVKRVWYSWVFLGVGAVMLVYFGLDLVPAFIEWFQLRSISKVKVEVVKDGEEDEEEDGKDLDEDSMQELLDGIGEYNKEKI